jgi:hypothetical protein
MFPLKESVAQPPMIRKKNNNINNLADIVVASAGSLVAPFECPLVFSFEIPAFSFGLRESPLRIPAESLVGASEYPVTPFDNPAAPVVFPVDDVVVVVECLEDWVAQLQVAEENPEPYNNLLWVP